MVENLVDVLPVATRLAGQWRVLQSIAGRSATLAGFGGGILLACDPESWTSSGKRQPPRDLPLSIPGILTKEVLASTSDRMQYVAFVDATQVQSQYEYENYRLRGRR